MERMARRAVAWVLERLGNLLFGMACWVDRAAYPIEDVTWGTTDSIAVVLIDEGDDIDSEVVPIDLGRCIRCFGRVDPNSDLGICATCVERLRAGICDEPGKVDIQEDMEAALRDRTSEFLRNYYEDLRELERERQAIVARAIEQVRTTNYSPTMIFAPLRSSDSLRSVGEGESDTPSSSPSLPDNEVDFRNYSRRSR